ncbi:MarR family winged helix-turn-helix transcriptional regulator [Tardiphaga sp.]|jgi:DNA-binding MarR family transcriptional regulator|uniref:MarR family winged helix-turn-helix transcriptional regulator n=1 Tax=Tardiphaga sp. TaxID=1926292 RepID=UPI0037DA0965
MPRTIRTPGHLIRRLQQVSVSVFHSSLEHVSITPVQHTILTLLATEKGLDQKTIAARAVLDTSTVGDVVRRLERRKLVARTGSPGDKRQKLVTITADGLDLIRQSRALLRRSRAQMFASLTSAEQRVFLDFVERLLLSNEPDTGQPWQRQRKRQPPRREV